MGNFNDKYYKCKCNCHAEGHAFCPTCHNMHPYARDFTLRNKRVDTGHVWNQYGYRHKG